MNMSMGDYVLPFTLLKGNATYDRVSEKIYVGLPAYQTPFLISENQNLVLMKGNSSSVVKVETIEQNGNSYILKLDLASNYNEMAAFLVSPASINSEEEVLLKVLSKSKELVKPSATIDVAAVPTPEALSALKEQILLGVTFAQAVELPGLNSSSQATIKINQGTPKKTAETFCADNVKAKISTKGDNDFIKLRGGPQKGIFVWYDQQKQERLDRYLDHMHAALRDKDVFVHFSVSLVDKNSKVVLNNQSVKRLRRTKNGGKINYILEIASGALMAFSGTYTVLIENETVDRDDFWDWNGSSGMPVQLPLSPFNKESPVEVEYFKKNNDGLAFDYLEFENPDSRSLNWNNKLSSLTVDDKTIYGNLKLTENGNVIFTKPVGMGQLGWAKDLADFKTRGKGHLQLLKQGSLAKPVTLQLKVDFGNVEGALDIVKQLQATTTTSVGELLPILGELNVTNADVAAAKAGVDILTAVASLATGTVKWSTDANYFEIDVSDNSRETFNVVHSNGAVEGFRQVYAAQLFDAVVLENKANYEKELQNIIDPTSAVKVIAWTANFIRMGESYQMAIQNAEKSKCADGIKYIFYHEEIPEQWIQVGNRDVVDVVVMFDRTEFQFPLPLSSL